jgi:DNA-binding transcriptional LysR family regulator
MVFHDGMSLADPLAGGEVAAFVTAVESGTVRGAADALALKQSAATKRRSSAASGGRSWTEARAGSPRPTLGACALPSPARRSARSSADGLKRAVLGGGFTLLSERVVANELAAGTLAAIPVAGVELGRSLRGAPRATRAARSGASILRLAWHTSGSVSSSKATPERRDR